MEFRNQLNLFLSDVYKCFFVYLFKKEKKIDDVHVRNAHKYIPNTTQLKSAWLKSNIGKYLNETLTSKLTKLMTKKRKKIRWEC